MKINNINAVNYGRFTQSFKSKPKEFNPYYDGSKVAKGANYEIIDSLDLKREKTINELREAKAKGTDISEDREKLIYSRIPTALEDAKEFVNSHPQFDYDDICQELIAIVIRKTDSELASDSGYYFFAQGYTYAKNKYFDRLLSNYTSEKDAKERYALTHVKFPDEILKEKETSIVLDKMTDKSLNKREKRTIYLRYGFIDGHCYKLNEIAKILNVENRRAIQIRDMALDKLARFRHCERVKREDFNL